MRIPRRSRRLLDGAGEPPRRKLPSPSPSRPVRSPKLPARVGKKAPQKKKAPPAPKRKNPPRGGNRGGGNHRRDRTPSPPRAPPMAMDEDENAHMVRTPPPGMFHASQPGNAPQVQGAPQHPASRGLRVDSNYKDVNNIRPDELKRAMDSPELSPYLHVWDARFKGEFDGGHIAGARHVKSVKGVIDALWDENGAAKLPEPHRQKLVFHCEYSQERAVLLLQMLLKFNGWNAPNNQKYEHMYLLRGGYNGFYCNYPDLCGPYVKEEALPTMGADRNKRGEQIKNMRDKLNKKADFVALVGKLEKPPERCLKPRTQYHY
ncbi:unnamed protein product [Vitrella brassicaformis CCMP3155]|uniref:protein-tyrosine-phosphatase n=1 Tax=Vitrella brassicaformis (strain CCMP3155) TaxID=1169540 RepID=A0A0G4EXK7_VITBC|nr:unnamed protein product [Vitrella brassicaformis CCMP3155]|eukprot:CEM03553.1 unnamed protein product [Vitrella brassicaformis CCMP3155]